MKANQKSTRARIKFLSLSAIIAALYVITTYFIAPIASGPIQVRISEALIALAVFTPAAIPGLTVGCLVANMLMGSMPLDVVFGSLATLIGALGGYYLGKVNKYLTPIPTIISNALIIPFVLKFVYGDAALIPIMMLTVGAGEVISAGILGCLLIFTISKNKRLEDALK